MIFTYDHQKKFYNTGHRFCLGSRSLSLILITDQVDVEVDWAVQGEEEVRNFRENFDPLRPDNLLSNLKKKKFFVLYRLQGANVIKFLFSAIHEFS
jgi:hypothetical protein